MEAGGKGENMLGAKRHHGWTTVALMDIVLKILAGVGFKYAVWVFELRADADGTAKAPEKSLSSLIP